MKVRQVDVTTVGIPHDGVSDGALQLERAAADLLTAGGGTLYFPPASYVFSKPLVLHPSISIVGAGNRSVVYYTGTGTWITRAVSLTHSNMRIANIRIIGTSAASGAIDLSAAQNLAWVTLEDLYISGFSGTGAAGIKATNLYLSQINRCHVIDCYDGIYLGQTCISNVIDTCWVRDFSRFGIAVYGTAVGPVQTNKIHDCIIDTSSLSPVPASHFGVYLGYAHSTHIYGNHLERCRTGVFVGDGTCQYNIIEHNSFHEGAGATPLTIVNTYTGATRTQIRSNFVTGPTALFSNTGKSTVYDKQPYSPSGLESLVWYSDGVADATAALTSVISAERDVYLPAGTFRTTSPIPLSGNLVGSDQRPEAALCAIVADHDGPVLEVDTDTARHVSASGLALLRSTGRERGPGVLVSGTSWTRGVSLSNVAITGHGIGVEVAAGLGSLAEFKMSRCSVTGNISGLVSYSYLTISSITDSNISQNWTKGVSVAAKGLSITGCDFEGQPSPLTISGSNNTAVLIDQNYFEGNSGEALINMGLCHGFHVGHQQISDMGTVESKVKASYCTNGTIELPSAILKGCTDVFVNTPLDDTNEYVSYAVNLRKWNPPTVSPSTMSVTTSGTTGTYTLGTADPFTVASGERLRVALSVTYQTPPTSAPTIIIYTKQSAVWSSVGKLSVEVGDDILAGDKVVINGSLPTGIVGDGVRLYCHPYGESQSGSGAELSNAKIWLGGPLGTVIP